MIEIPERFVAIIGAREGDPGRAWIRGLPALVTELLDTWRCLPSGTPLYGQVALVVPVRRADGSGAVLKVSWPHAGNRAEPAALTAWQGRGAIRLLERDDARYAMLLERLRPRSAHELRDPFAMISAAGRLVRRLAIPAPPELPRLADVAASWLDRIPAESAALGDPLPRAAVDAAVATARELGPGQPGVIVHGDLHPGNILRGRRAPWLVIDPKGFAGDPAFDSVALLRSCWPELVSGHGVARAVSTFAETAGVEAERVRRWAQARAVVGALWSLRHGDPPGVVEVCREMATALTAPTLVRG